MKHRQRQINNRSYKLYILYCTQRKLDRPQLKFSLGNTIDTDSTRLWRIRQSQIYCKIKTMGSDSLLGFIFRPIIYIKKGYKCQPSSDRFFYKIPFFKCSLIYNHFNKVYNTFIYPYILPLFTQYGLLHRIYKYIYVYNI